MLQEWLVAVVAMLVEVGGGWYSRSAFFRNKLLTEHFSPQLVAGGGVRTMTQERKIGLDHTRVGG